MKHTITEAKQTFLWDKCIRKNDRNEVWEVATLEKPSKHFIAKVCHNYDAGIRQVAWLKMLQGPYVVPLIEYYKQEHGVVIIMEKCRQVTQPSDLQDVLTLMDSIIDVSTNCTIF